MKKDRKDLEKEIKFTVNHVRHDEEMVEKLEKEMHKCNINVGLVQKFLINVETEVSEIDLRLLALYTEGLYKATGNLNLRPELYFTENDLKQVNIYDVSLEKEEKVQLPIEFNNVVKIDDETYITTIDINLINLYMKSSILRYNFDTQRDARIIKRFNKTERIARLNSKSVEEITERVIRGDLSITPLTFNALVGSAEYGDELTYDARKQRLIVNKGTFLDILDGFHRITGTLNALEINPDLKFTFLLIIKNLNTSKAQKYLAEISKINPIDKAHVQSLEQSRYSDFIVKQLMIDSDLKGKISKRTTISTINNELVSYSVLADTIDEEFKIESKREADEIAKYLTIFFDYLIGTYPEAFITNVEKIRKESLFNYSGMFAGYIVLAKRMKDENIEIKYLEAILNNINFQRSNPLWKELRIIESNKIGRKNMRKIIKNYFKNINIKEVINI